MNTTRGTSWAAAALAGVAAVLGLVLPGAYPDVAGTDAMLRGYDLVTLLLVVPGLALAQRAQRRPGPHVPARLVEMSLLTYLGYTYVYYVLGIGFTELLLLHITVLATALAALVLAVARVRSSAVTLAFDPHTPARPAAVILGLLSVALGGMWVFWSLHAAATGDVPPGSSLVESDTIVHLGLVLDLTVLVPLYAVAAVLLWRRAAWGYVLATVALIAGLLHQISYLVALAAQYAADVPGAVAFDAVEPVIVLLYAGAAISLVGGLARRHEAVAPTDSRDLRRRSHVHAR